VCGPCPCQHNPLHQVGVKACYKAGFKKGMLDNCKTGDTRVKSSAALPDNYVARNDVFAAKLLDS
jgi:hypothetical protein